jgi:hypothetical protein
VEELIPLLLVSAGLVGPLAGAVAAGLSILKALESDQATRNLRKILATQLYYDELNRLKVLETNIENLLLLVNQTEEQGHRKVLEILKTSKYSEEIGLVRLKDKDQEIVAGFLAQNSNASKRMYLESALSESKATTS